MRKTHFSIVVFALATSTFAGYKNKKTEAIDLVTSSNSATIKE